MAEFRVHHLISQLVDATGGDPALAGRCVELIDSVSADEFNHVGMVTAKATITRHCAGNAHDFLQRYERIRSTRSKELDPMVYVLSKVIGSPDLQRFVEQASPAPGMAADSRVGPAPPSAVLSDDALQKLRLDLAAATGAIKKGSVGAGAGGKAYNRKHRQLDAATPPDWYVDRPFMTADFPRLQQQQPDPTSVAIGTLPLQIQELAIVDDLLFAMGGVEGKYIRITDRGNAEQGYAQRLEIERTLDPSLRDLADRILPLAQQYSSVARFIDGKEGYLSGTVRQSLTAAMQGLVKEYLIVVAQLETQFKKGGLSLQRLWFYVQPCMRTVEVLAMLVDEIVRGDLRGGGLLSLLHTHSVNQLSDSRAQELCLHLAQAASAPYFTILEQWIYKGVIDDPYSEFLVKEEKGLHRDQAQRMYNDIYWERRYTVCADRTPKFLSAMADKILRTGKYLNVIRESGGNPHFPEALTLEYQLRDRAFINVIEDAYAYASKSLLHLLNTDMQLLQQLTSIKNYFCMQMGDFFAHFLDIAEGELSKIVRDIEPSRVEALLGLALRMSTAKDDPFKENLKFGLVPHNLVTELFRIMNITHDYKGNERGFVNPDTFTLEGPDSMAGSTLTGLEAFTFEYEVEWPVSLVISRKSIKRYQLIFRHLFRCRHVELTLCRTWLDDQFFKDVPHIATSARAAAFALRQRMLNFVQSFQYYTMYEVIEPNWHVMADRLGEATTLDDVLEIHSSFLDTCLKECMLTNPTSLKTISKLLSVCAIFGTGMKSLSGEAFGTSRMATSKKFETSINQFDTKFGSLMRELIASLTEFASSATEQHMSNMVARLDFNGYYSSAFADDGSAATGSSVTARAPATQVVQETGSGAPAVAARRIAQSTKSKAG